MAGFILKGTYCPCRNGQDSHLNLSVAHSSKCPRSWWLPPYQPSGQLPFHFVCSPLRGIDTFPLTTHPSFPHIDVPQDHAFFATMYKFASKYKVKTILTGGNYSTECVRNPLEWMYYQSDSIQLNDIYRRFGTGKLKDYKVTNILWHKIWLPYFKGIKLYRPLDLIPYNKEQAMQELVDKFGYQKYPQKHFESRFTRFYEGFWLPERFGFDTRKVQFSSLILTNQMTRNEALVKLKEKVYTKDQIDEDFEFVSNKLGITVDELWSYFNAPKKTFKDYKSQENLYYLGAKVMRYFKLEKGGKR